MSISEILASFRAFSGEYFRSVPLTPEQKSLAHETRQRTRNKEESELIHKDETRRSPALKILASFRVFSGQNVFTVYR